MAMQKKAKAPEPAGESAPMWIVSFADLVTLMMSFFVVLYALKQGGEKQQLEVAAAIRAAFDPTWLPAGDSEFEIAVRKNHGLLGPPYPNAGGMAPNPTEGATGRDNQVTTLRPNKQIVTGAKITFLPGRSELDAEAAAAIREIAGQLRGHNNICFVKGHASKDELASRRDDPHGLTLSHERAQHVIDALMRQGIDQGILRLLECGDFEPVKTGVYDPSSLRMNRRVEVYATENTASEFNPRETVPATEQANAAKS